MARAPQINDWFKVKTIAEHAIALNNDLASRPATLPTAPLTTPAGRLAPFTDNAG